VASNAPSIMVLDRLQPESPVPIFGVYPPLEKAEAASRSGGVGIMGVRSLVESAMLPAFVAARSRDPSRVALINASPMVELVESGAFLFDPARTQAEVNAFMDAVDAAHPGLDVLTLS